MRKLFILLNSALFTIPLLIGCNQGPRTYSISLVQPEHGLVHVSKETKIEAGETITISNTPDTGYELYHYLLDGEVFTETSFVMPERNVTLSALFSDGYFDITCAYNETIYFAVENTHVYRGEEVVIDYMPITNYVLDKFYVNGEAIEGDTFIMPNKNVEITATTRQVYIESPASIYLPVAGREQFDTRSNWFFEYGETGMHIKAIVWDHFIVDNPATMPDVGYRDNIEFTISPLMDMDGYVIDQTYNILVSVDGVCWFRKASSSESFVDTSYLTGQFVPNVQVCHYIDKDGFEGYIVDVYLDYSLWGTSQDSASFVVCFSHRNTINYYKTYWDFYRDLGCSDNTNPRCFPLINKDGSLSRNPYLTGGE